MARKRGALLVLEGCDRAGKSTQVKMLVKALQERGIPAESKSFPNRTTLIGSHLSNYLSGKAEIAPETVHLLFSANRWECRKEILDQINSGITLIIDRYAASGAAYSAVATGRSLAWCKLADSGLPRPDMVILLDISQNTLKSRGDWGMERYEENYFQKEVASNYYDLKDDSWNVIDAHEDILAIHNKILQSVTTVVERVKDMPIGVLYQ